MNQQKAENNMTPILLQRPFPGFTKGRSANASMSRPVVKALTVSILAGLTLASSWAEDITTTTGKQYTDVTIARVEPDGIVVTTDSGIERISFDILSKELQTKYGYDPQRAAKFRAAVQVANAQRQVATDATMAAMKQQEATKAAVEAVLNAKPPKGQTGKPGIHVLRVNGRVLQILSDGILLAGEWLNQVVEPAIDGQDPESGGGVIIREPLLILCPSSKYVDGDKFSGVIYPAGTYTYTSTLGADKTVRCYAVNPQVAVQRQSGK